MNLSLQRLKVRLAILMLAAVSAGAIHLGIGKETSLPSDSLTKEIVLRELAKGVIAPGYADLSSKCRQLASATARLQETPDAANLKQAREAWIELAVRSESLRCVAFGPIVDHGSRPLFYFLPARPASVERAISAKQPLTPARIEELGAAAKGISALEYLLFPAGDPEGTSSNSDKGADSTLAALQGEGGRVRRQYITLLAQNLATHADRVAGEWQASTATAAEFINGGQASMNMLINRIGWCMEHIILTHLHFIEQDPQKCLGARSGTTDRLLLTSLQGIRQVYQGAGSEGLDDYLRSRHLPATDQIEQLFSESIESVSALAISKDRLDASRNAAGNCHNLELAIKVELMSALGVTLSFSSIDGD